MSIRDKLHHGLKVTFLSICVAFALSGHPPAYPQRYAPIVSAEDAVQDTKISGLTTDLGTVAANLQRQIDVNSAAITRNFVALGELQKSGGGNQGEMRWLFGALAAMQAGTYVTGRKKARREP